FRSLQPLLENEKIMAYVETSELYSNKLNLPSMLFGSLPHPRFGIGPTSHVLYLSTQMRVADVINMISGDNLEGLWCLFLYTFSFSLFTTLFFQYLSQINRL